MIITPETILVLKEEETVSGLKSRNLCSLSVFNVLGTVNLVSFLRREQVNKVHKCILSPVCECVQRNSVDRHV